MLRRKNGNGSPNPGRPRTRKVLLLGSLLATAIFSTAAIGGDGTLVHTKDGLVRGFIDAGVYKFLGIPYSAPPVGSLRWMPPESHAPE